MHHPHDLIPHRQHHHHCEGTARGGVVRPCEWKGRRRTTTLGGLGPKSTTCHRFDIKKSIL
jgi:hypothetical protein